MPMMARRSRERRQAEEIIGMLDEVAARLGDIRRLAEELQQGEEGPQVEEGGEADG